ncbi:MAG: hypothetical protein GY820_29675, partial [Gammaproteobacteria bacterium]|nr:hypothetical protein [Gammaproteobacteria bacterium]
NDEVLGVSYTNEDEFVPALPNTSKVIAAFTTTWARLALYKYLDLLGERVLYCDTDR